MNKKLVLFNIFLGILILFVLAGCENILGLINPEKIEPKEYNASDYVSFTVGSGIKYHVTDEYQSLDCNVWAISQKIPASSSGDMKYDYIVTLTKAGTTGGYFRNSTLGAKTKNDGSFDYFSFYSGMGVGNQANFYRNIFQLKSFMTEGETYSLDYYGDFTVEDGGSVTINGYTFDNCLKINFTRNISGDSWETYTNGSGYGIFAPNVGLVKLEFTRSSSSEEWSNKKVVFEYTGSQNFTAHTISGTVTTDGSTSASDLYVQISSRILDPLSKTDSSGDFALADIYGPDILLYIGYDGNDSHDGVLDYDYPDYPKEIIVNDITGDISDFSINLSEH